MIGISGRRGLLGPGREERVKAKDKPDIQDEKGFSHQRDIPEIRMNRKPG